MAPQPVPRARVVAAAAGPSPALGRAGIRSCLRVAPIASHAEDRQASVAATHERSARVPVPAPQGAAASGVPVGGRVPLPAGAPGRTTSWIRACPAVGQRQHLPAAGEVLATANGVRHHRRLARRVRSATSAPAARTTRTSPYLDRRRGGRLLPRAPTAPVAHPAGAPRAERCRRRAHAGPPGPAGRSAGGDVRRLRRVVA